MLDSDTENRHRNHRCDYEQWRDCRENPPIDVRPKRGYYQCSATPYARLSEPLIKSDATVIEHLNRVLKNELTAINQHFLHSRMLKDWGFTKLDDHEHEESIDDRIGEDAPEILRCDLDVDLDAIPDLGAAIAYCENHKDYVSRELFDEILASED